jgi:archaellum component FlaC
MDRYGSQIEDLQAEGSRLAESFAEFSEAQRHFLSIELDEMQYYWRSDPQLSAQLQQVSEDIQADSKTMERMKDDRLDEIAHDIKQLTGLQERAKEDKEPQATGGGR